MEMSESVGRTEEKPVSDGWLVAAARRGDMRAFETLYRTHSGRVYGLCLRMTRRPDVAEDCVQQTFVRAWRNLASFEGRSSFGTWLHRIAVNEVLTHERNHGTRSESDEEQVAALDNEAQGNEPFDAADVMDVERAIQLLPDGAATRSCCKRCTATAMKRSRKCWGSRSVPAKRKCIAVAACCARGWACRRWSHESRTA